MAIVKQTQDEKRLIERGDSTSTYETSAPVPAWGADGAMVQAFCVSNNKDRAILYATTIALGLRSPELHVVTHVDLSLNDLDQLITELQAIRDDLLNEAAKENARRAHEAAQKDPQFNIVSEAREAAERGEIPTRKWDI